MGRNAQKRRAQRHGGRRLGAVVAPSLAGNRWARRHALPNSPLEPTLVLDSGGDAVVVEAPTPMAPATA